jgi:hypothetical protein
MTDRELAMEVVHELELDAASFDLAGYSIRREQACAIRRLVDKSEGGPVAPTVSAVLGALVQMNAEHLGHVRRAVDAAIREGWNK